MSIYDDLRVAVNAAALSFMAEGKNEFTSGDICDKIKRDCKEEWSRFEPSFQVTFSALTKDPECVVERVPGRYLYQIASEASLDGVDAVTDVTRPITLDTACPEIDATASNRSQREIKLYAILKGWLASRGYQAAITATTRRGGKWGNPDVAGIRVDELPLGSVSFECATIEAKLTSSDWQYWLFEAVAHKRFAHRAYFAFAFGTDTPGLDKVKDSERMCEYAEKYRIGILVVFISKDHYDQLTSGDISALNINTDDARIETLWPAFYEPVQTPALNEYMRDCLEISNFEDLHNFGHE